MKKNQSFDHELVLRVWKEMLAAYEAASPPPYPSVRTVADKISAMGFTTYKNAPPSRETIRACMRKTEEGKELLEKGHAKYRAGGEYAG